MGSKMMKKNLGFTVVIVYIAVKVVLYRFLNSVFAENGQKLLNRGIRHGHIRF